MWSSQCVPIYFHERLVAWLAWRVTHNLPPLWLVVGCGHQITQTSFLQALKFLFMVKPQKHLGVYQQDTSVATYYNCTFDISIVET